MEEFDLNNIWNQSEAKADDYYNSIKSELMEKAKKNSNNILDKIKKNIKLEWVFSILLGVFVVFYTRDITWISMFIVMSLIMWLPYRGLLKNIEKTPTKNIKNALESYIDILDKFINRLKLITIILLPLVVFLGLAILVEKEEMFAFNDLLDIKVLFYFGAILCAYSLFMCWALFKWYIPALYGNPKKELEEILAGLNQEIS